MGQQKGVAVDKGVESDDTCPFCEWVLGFEIQLSLLPITPLVAQ